MKNKIKKCMLGLTVLLLSTALVGCGNEASTTAGNAGDKMKVEVIAKGFQHDFWRAVEAGAMNAAREFDVEVTFVGPSSETAIAEQVEMLNSAINRRPSAIALAALDTNASVDAITKAYSNGIPIIGFDSGVPGAPSGTIAANAATDNYAAGELAAENAYEAIKDQFAGSASGALRIGVVSQEVNSLSIYERTAGFVDKMELLLSEDGNVGAEYVSIIGHTRFSNGIGENGAKAIIEVRVPAEVTDSAGRTEAQTLLNKQDLITIFGSNEFGANAIINANSGLSQGRIGNDVIAVGFDSGVLQQDAVRSGQFYGSVTQNPVSIGFESVRLAVAAAKGESVADVDTGAEWYNQDNIDSADIQALLYQ